MSLETFEQELTVALDDLADSVPVEVPSFEPARRMGSGPAGRPAKSNGRLGLVAACAAVFVALVAGLSALGLGSTTAAGSGSASGSTVEFTIWMEVGVDPAAVDDVRSTLDAAGEHVDYHYVDVDEAFEQFKTHFADQPELLELVEPDQLPTSFQVEADREGDVAALIDDIVVQPGVADVETLADASESPHRFRDVLREIEHNLRRLSPFHE